MGTAWDVAQGSYSDFDVSWHYHLIFPTDALLWIPEEWRDQVRFFLHPDSNPDNFSDYLHCLAVSFGDGNGFVCLEIPLVVEEIFTKWAYEGFATNKETIAEFLLIADRLIEHMREEINKTKIVNLQW